MILHAVDLGTGAVPVVVLHGLFGSAQNFASLQKQMAASGRVIALDLRNHGHSPHAPVGSYAELAEDVLETLRARDALPCRLLGHSMGGKTAMAAALAAPDAVERLLVADIAPVAYPPAFRAYAAAMRAMTLTPTLTRAEADAALAPVVPERGVRAFLLQNLRLGGGAMPGWRIGLDAIARSLPVIEGWSDPPGHLYPGPTLFLSGIRSDYILPAYRPAIRALFPQARFLALNDAGHWLHADNPAGFLATVTRFFGPGAPPA